MSNLTEKVTITLEIERNNDEDDSADLCVLFRLRSERDQPFHLGTVLRGTLLGLSGFMKRQAKFEGLAQKDVYNLVANAVLDIFTEGAQSTQTVCEMGADTDLLN